MVKNLNEFLQYKGVRCPICLSTDFVWFGEVDGSAVGVVREESGCYSCESLWTNEYQLTGVKITFDGLKGESA